MKKSKETNVKLIRFCISFILVIILAAFSEYQAQNSKNIISSSNELNQENLISKNQTSTVNIDISNIPDYSGEIVIDVNNNIPYFTDEETTTDEFEMYSEFDDLKRCGVAFANISKFTMPPEGTKRGNISYKPTGWIQHMYGEGSKEHLYERCHMIAWQLGNENNNSKNLITGTSSMNSAMIPLENMVANWIKTKSKEGKDYHVLYRVTPVFEGENLLATGVLIEAKSVEEEGISFNKFIYNVQDGFVLNYKTGESEEI